jgi:putative ABC transport system ATP-binding protein
VEAIIELQQITKAYCSADTRHLILKNIDLQIHAGDFLAIMGASGSGKSTLMNILGLLDKPTSGQYFLKGKPIAALAEDALALLRNRTIGFIFQSFFLLPRLTILQNVGLPLHYRQATENNIQGKAQQMLEKVGLADFATRKPNQLSGGQQQRAAIARALIGQPSVILADEPTGALDTQTGQHIMNLLLELNQQEKVTVIIVTHDPAIAKQCKRIIKIHDGEISV